MANMQRLATSAIVGGRRSASLIDLAGGPDMAPRPPSLGRAPAAPGRASGLPPDVSWPVGDRSVDRLDRLAKPFVEVELQRPGQHRAQARGVRERLVRNEDRGRRQVQIRMLLQLRLEEAKHATPPT